MRPFGWFGDDRTFGRRATGSEVGKETLLYDVFGAMRLSALLDVLWK